MVVVEEEEEEEFTHWSLGNFWEDSEIRTKQQVLERRKRRRRMERCMGRRLTASESSST